MTASSMGYFNKYLFPSNEEHADLIPPCGFKKAPTFSSAL